MYNNYIKINVYYTYPLLPISFLFKSMFPYIQFKQNYLDYVISIKLIKFNQYATAFGSNQLHIIVNLFQISEHKRPQHMTLEIQVLA